MVLRNLVYFIIWFLLSPFISFSQNYSYSDIESQVETLHEQGRMIEMAELVSDSYYRITFSSSDSRPKGLGYLLTVVTQELSLLREYQRVYDLYNSIINDFLNTYPKEAAPYSLYIRLYSAYPISQYDFALAKEIIDQAEQEVVSDNYMNGDRMFFYNYKGKILSQFPEYLESSISVYKQGIFLKDSTGIDLSELATSYGSLASLFYRKGDMENAINNHLKAIEIRSADPSLRNYLAISYNNLASIFSEIGDFARAADNFRYASDLVSNTTQASRDQALFLRNYGMALEELGELYSALRVFEMTDSIESLLMSDVDPIRGITFNRLAKIHYRLGNISEAQTLTNKALRNFNNAPNPSEFSESLIGGMFTLAYCAFEIGDFPEFKNVQRAIRNQKHLSHLDSLMIDYLSVKLAVAQSKPSQALAVSKEILEKSEKNRFHFTYTDLRLAIVKLLLTKEMIDIGGEAYVEVVLSMVDESITDIYFQINNKLYWKDQLNISESYFEIFNLAIHACYNLYEKTKDPSFVIRANRLISYSKNKQVRGQLLQFDNSSEEAKKEVSIAKLFAFYQDKKLTSTNEVDRKFYNQKIIEVNNQLLEVGGIRGLIREGLKDDLDFSQFSEELGFINSFIGEDHYYYTGMLDQPFFIKVYHAGLIDSLSQQVIKMLSRPDTQIDTSLLIKLSRIILGPIYNSERIKTLHVSPHGILAKVPFDVLFSNSNEMLVQRMSITYIDLNSTSINKKQNKIEFDYVGIAPDYSSYASLPFAIQEVDNAHQVFSKSKLIKKPLTKEKLFEIGEITQVLHLATHSVYNDQVLFDSRIILGDEKDESISLREVAEMTLPGSLVVANTCDSGNGDLIRSEGVISISSAFMMAGANEVLTSLWKANDFVGSKIIKLFFQKYASGISTPKALQEAKMKFLRDNERPELRHPYYWSNLRLTSIRSIPVKSQNWPTSYWIYVTVFLISILVLLFKGRRIYQTK